MKAASPQLQPCVRIILTADSILVAMEQRSCQDTTADDTITVWRAASRHRRCDGIGQIDGTTGLMRFEWGSCKDTAYWVGRRMLPLQRASL